MLPAPPPARRLTVTLALACGLAASSVSLAQNNKTTPEPALKGPQVTDRNVPGAAPDFGMGANRRFGDRVPPDVFRRAFNVLTEEDAPDDLRATPEQRAKFKELIEGFEDSVKKYRQEHAKEMDELRKAAGEPRGGRPGARRQQQREEQMAPEVDLTPEQQKARDTARAKLRELTAGAPKIEDVYTKVWTELKEPQRKAVQAELDEWRDEQAKRREDEYVRRQMNQKDAAGGAGGAGGAGRPNAPARANRPAANPPASDDAMMAPKSDSMNEDREEARKEEAKKDERKEARKDNPDDDSNPRISARRDRLLRLFAQLSPEEQEQLLQRLENRFQNRRPDGAARRAEPKPPADPNQVKIPKPDDDKQ